MNNSFPASLGLEISKADLDRLSDTILSKLVLHHKFLLIRALSLSPEQLIEYGRKFGKLYLSSSDLQGNGESIFMKSTDHQEITVLSRDGLHQDSEIEWHIDLLHRPSTILPGRILYAHRSDVGSTTSWTDTERAYELMDDASRTLAEESFGFYVAPYPTAWLGAVREMVFNNPLTQGRSLLLDKTFTRCIIGKTCEDTDALKSAVFSRTLIAENIYAHNWRKGDLIIYDNNSTMHQREIIETDSEGDRTIWRLTFDFV